MHLRESSGTHTYPTSGEKSILLTLRQGIPYEIKSPMDYVLRNFLKIDTQFRRLPSMLSGAPCSHFHSGMRKICKHMRSNQQRVGNDIHQSADFQFHVSMSWFVDRNPKPNKRIRTKISARMSICVNRAV